MSDVRGKAQLSREQAVIEAMRQLEAEPDAKTVREWLHARVAVQQHTGNPGCAERAERIARLSRDDLYCELAAAQQRAINKLVQRRRELIGDGTT